MKKSSRIIVVLVVAAATYGSLVAIKGTDHWNRYGHYHYEHHCEKSTDREPVD